MRSAKKEKKRFDKNREVRLGMKAIKASLVTGLYWLLLILLFRYVHSVTGLVVWACFMIFPPMAFYLYAIFFRRDYPYRKGMVYFDRQKFRQAEQEFGASLSNLHIGAAKMLGDIYLDGKRGAPDPDRAVWVYGEAFRGLRFIREVLPDLQAGSFTDKYLSSRYLLEQTPGQADAWFKEIEVRLQALADSGHAGAAELLEEVRAEEGEDSFP